jgi:CubicO group peptidase (beta-lactamase class C family)
VNNQYVDYTEIQLLDYLERYTPASAGPYRPAYSNVGFAVLGYALTRATHASYDELLATRILTPLGMSQTTVNRATAPAANLIDGYDLARAPAEHWQWDVFAPTGGIVSTASDMMKYLAANLAPDDTALGQAMKQSQVLGLGWDSAPGAATVWKNGDTGGFSAMILFNPVAGMGAFVLANDVDDYTDSVVALVPGDTQPDVLPDLMGKTVPVTVLQSYEGTYQDSQKIVTVHLRLPSKFLVGTELIDPGAGATPATTQIRLDATSDTTFNVFDNVESDGSTTVSFVVAADGTVSGLVAHLHDGSGSVTDVTLDRQ